MNSPCPNCHLEDPRGSKVVREGKFFRHSTQSFVQKYRCKKCEARYSDAIFEDSYRQKKRFLNPIVSELLAHLVSQREVARMLKINYKTVVRKFHHQAWSAERDFHKRNLEKEKAQVVEFDDMETFEHTKHKPLSITIAIEAVTRRILALAVSSMPARGRLAEAARSKYGKRLDLRQKTRRRLFENLPDLVAENAEFRSDKNPSYPSLIRRGFPQALHQQFAGRRGCVTGQGELKAGGFDPLFSINHTCAMFRANVNRLIRKTWCTTKSAERLREHLILYANEHNKRLDETSARRAALAREIGRAHV